MPPAPSDPGIPYKEITYGTESIRIYDNGVLYAKNLQIGDEFWSVPNATTGGSVQITKFPDGRVFTDNYSSTGSRITREYYDPLGQLAERTNYRADGLAMIAKFIGDNQLDTVTVGNGDGTSFTRAVAQMTEQELGGYGLFNQNSISNRLIQLGVSGSDSYLTNGFAALGAANGNLDQYSCSIGGNGYVMANSLTNLLINNALGWNNQGSGAVANPNAPYTVSPIVKNAIACMGYAANLASPLVLDLDGDGVAVDLTHAYNDGKVFFDIDGDGYAERVGWVNPNDGLLATDTNGNGNIDNITELYGDDLMPAFQKLRGLDANADGQITDADAGYASLLVWQDNNQDGISQTGELKTLTELGIASISTNDHAVPVAQQWSKENYLSSTASYTLANGVTREITDVHFLNDNVNAWYLGAHSQVYGADVRINLDALMLPLSRGYGTLASLHLAMTDNPDLLQLVKELAYLPPERIAETGALVENILYEWAGVRGNDPDARATSDGAFIDARQVDFIEKFTGVTWAQQGSAAFTGEDASTALKKTWEGIHANFVSRFLVQGPLKGLFPGASYDFAADTLTLGGTLDGILAQAGAYAAQIAVNGAADTVGQGEFWRVLGTVLADNRNQLGKTLAEIDTSVSAAAGFRLYLGEMTLTAADTGIYTGKNNAPELLDSHTFVGDGLDNTINGTGGEDFVFGGDGNDQLSGGGGEDYLRGDAGNDVIEGGAGADRLEGGAGADTVSGGDGNDYILSNEGNDVISGGAGDDLIAGGTGADILDGGAGRDTVFFDSLTNGGYINLYTGEAHGVGLEGDAISNFESIRGGGYSDVLVGDAGANSFNGESGDDILIGGAGDDSLFGATGRNKLYGGDGNDQLQAFNEGNEYFDGGAGWDTVSFDHPYLTNMATGVYVDLGLGRGLGGAAKGDVFVDIEAVKGSYNLNDVLIGNNANNILDGNGGQDVLRGEGGNDWLFAADGISHLFGGTGSDGFSVLGKSIDRLNGAYASTQGNATTGSTVDPYAVELPENAVYIHDFELNNPDEKIDLSDVDISQVVLQQRGADVAIALGGNRTLYVMGVNVAQLSAGHFILPAGVQGLTVGAEIAPAVLTVLGSDADNKLYGGNGNDILEGYGGNDALVAGAGNDLLRGGNSDDLLVGGLGADVLDGGAGIDQVRYDDSFEGVTVNLVNGTGAGGSASGDLLSNIEKLTGSNFGDALRGANTGSETIEGLNGDDVLVGGDGNNTLTGGDGADRFVIEASVPATAFNAITDFDLANPEEKIDLTAFDFTNQRLVAEWNTNLTELNFYTDTGALYKGALKLTCLNWGTMDTPLPKLSDMQQMFVFADGKAPLGFEVRSPAGASVYGSNGTDLLKGANSYYFPQSGNDTIDIGVNQTGGFFVTRQPGQVIRIQNFQNSVERSVFTPEAGGPAVTMWETDARSGWFDLSRHPDIHGFGDIVVSTVTSGPDAGTHLDLGNGQKIILMGWLENAPVDTSELGNWTGYGLGTVRHTIDYGLEKDDRFIFFGGTLNGTFGDDHMNGGKYGDIIAGGFGDDVIDGGGGNDVLEGGDGGDTFVIQRKAGATDRIKDFQFWQHGDVIDLTAFTEIDGFTGLKGMLSLQGNDTVISLGAGQSLVIEGVTPELLGGWGFKGLNIAPTGNVAVNSTVTQNKTLTAANTLADADGLGAISYQWQSSGDGAIWTNIYGATGNTFSLTGAQAGQQVRVNANYTDGNGTAENVSSAATAYIVGSTWADVLTGTTGMDVIDGLPGADSMVGGLGDDTYYVDDAGDVVTENASEGTDTVQSSVSYALGANVENLTLTGPSTGSGQAAVAINGIGNALNNVLTGNSGNNVLYGNAGADTMLGGAGDDIYMVDDVGDMVTENANEGIDNVQSSVSYTLGANMEQLLLLGGENLTGTGNALNNFLGGNSGANVLDGGNGNDALNGGLGADTMLGGAGDDTYFVDDTGDVVTENASEGIDMVQSGVSFTLGANVETLVLLGSANLTGTGNTLNNTVQGNSGANVLDGGAGNDILYGGSGADTMLGGAGDDIYYVDELGDVLTENASEGTDTVYSSVYHALGANVENLTLTGTAGINGIGNALNNVLIGNSGNNTLNGLTGADTMQGGAGDDFYSVDDVGDMVTENTSEGTDTVQSSVSYALGANVENLWLAGTAAINGTGNALNNYLGGTSGANILDGGAGNDVLYGGLGTDTMLGVVGDDTYYVDDIGDVVIENANEGSDWVYSSIAYSLDANVENLVLIGTAAINGTGNALNNYLGGNSGANALDGGVGNDTLNGGLGADTMLGGAGDDIYYVDDAGDVVTENASEGTDTVYSSISYTLGANMENLALTGTAAINSTGNALNNVLIGNTGNNLLTGSGGNDVIDGSAGADTMLGGTDDDTYVVDNVGDVVIENISEGTDKVHSFISYALTDNVENLSLFGAAAINGTGNALNNVLTGNSAVNVLDGGAGNDTLDGGVGADTMLGGAGDDTYVVDNPSADSGQAQGDMVIENLSEGTDTVQSSITYTLTDNVENLTLTGAAALSGTGNVLDNTITGNTGANTLAGGAGNDTLTGGGEADTLDGGAGDDTYQIFLGDGADSIADNSGNDRIVFGAGIVASDVTASRSGSLVKLAVSSTDSISFAETSPGQFAMEQVTFADDTIWQAVDLTRMLNAALTGSVTVSGTATQNQTLTASNNLADADGLGAIAYQWQSSADGIIWSNITDATASTFTLAEAQVGQQVRVNASYTDGHGTNESADSAATTAVVNVNDAPMLASTMTNQFATQNMPFTFQIQAGTFTDADTIHGDTLAYTASLTDGVALPPWLTFDATTQTFSGTPGNTDVGNLSLLVTVTDSGGSSAASSFNLSVANTNDAPVLASAVTSQAATEGIAFSFAVPAGTFTDIDAIYGDTLSYSATLSDGSALPAWLSFDAVTQVFSGTAGQNDLGSLQVTVTATDQGGLATSGSLRLDVAQHGDAILAGTAVADTLTGYSGNDMLDGGADADTMTGRNGNDTYVVDNAGDLVFEELNGGTDLVNSSITYTLTGNVENLTLTGITDINATGNAQDNVLTGNDGANIIDSGAGADVMIGGAGSDTYIVDNAGDAVVENLNEGIDLAKSSITYTLTDNTENLILTGAADINGTGNAQDNIITGNDCANVLDGSAGIDTMIGGKGDDTYVVDDAGDVVVEVNGEGWDTVESSVSYTLSANVNQLALTGTANIDGTGNDLDNDLYGNSGVNTLIGGAGWDWIDGGAGADTMVGGAGKDTYFVDNVSDVVVEVNGEGWDTVESSVSYTLSANVNQLTLTGTDNLDGTGNELDNDLYGNSGVNILTGGAGWDWIDGGAGADTMIGGTGDDTYIVDNVGEVVTESLNEGKDTVQSSIDYMLGANIENLTLIDAALTGTGNALDNMIMGNASNNILDGGVGADTLIGGAGNDTYVVDNVGDLVEESLNEGVDTVQSSIAYILGANVENLMLIGAALTGTGNALNNMITGNASNNSLNGGLGADSMIGGLGDDSYYVDNVGDSVTELAGEGNDIIYSSVNWALGANVERLYLTGATAINATGNELANTLYGSGNSAANVLAGGLGNDIYMVGAGDTVVENAGEGTDNVWTYVNYTLGANIENLYLYPTVATAAVLTGNDLANSIQGNTGNDTLVGLGGNDALTGLAGADTMIGGLGDDNYYVENAGDIVTELVGEGNDIIYSSLTWTLGANVERLYLTGTTAINATGNELANTLYGHTSSAVNVLTGGLGDDLYHVGAGDIVVENAGEGIDTVVAYASYTLGNNVENLTLTSTSGASNGTGNASNNVITGNVSKNTLNGGAGDDTLNGAGGGDTMIGGLGNDVYVVINSTDVLVENLNEGVDTTQSAVSYTLSANIENLTLTGTALGGTGNTLDNYLLGNASNNTLNGAGGNDLLQGGLGDDTLSDTLGNNLLDGGAGADTLTGSAGNELFTGGAGNDTINTGNGADIIAFNRGNGQDILNGGVGTDNTISLGGGIQYADLALSKTGNDLILEVGNGDQITLSNWYDTAANYKSVLNLQVVADAMAAFDPASADPMLNKAIQDFDFTTLVASFDQARGADPTFLHWNAMNSLLNAHLSASDTAALGGDLAHQYGMGGSFSGMNLTAAQNVINAPQFGAQAQTLNSLQGLQGGLVTLAA